VRKTILGAASGVVVAGGLAAMLLGAGTSSAAPAPHLTGGTQGGDAGAVQQVLLVGGRVTPHAVTKPRVKPKPKPKPRPKAKPKPKPKPKVPPIKLPVPAPPKVVLSPDPNSALCRTTPSTTFCAPNSVRYVLAGTTLAAHAKWLPVLTKWGITDVSDTCVSAPMTASTLCAIQGSHGDQHVTAFFKAVYETRYAPDTVKAQAAAIHAKAMDAAMAAKTVAQQAQILAAANAKITALQKAAEAYNRAHPKTTVNVVLS
jgi:hypothetical protein